MPALSTCVKRLVKERERLPKENVDFWIGFKDENLRQFSAYVIGPEDSVYRHKLVKLKFDVPEQYPLVPPKVTFVQHTGDRIHPNLYTEGKVCLSILGTWPGDPWTYSMRIEGVLITIRSLLDNQPYLHEPHQKDNPAYNDYVRYTTWQCLLLDYFEREQDPDAKKFLAQIVRKHGDEMIKELERQKMIYGNYTTFTSPYRRGSLTRADYDALIRDLKSCISQYKDLAPSEESVEIRSLETEQRKRMAPDSSLSEDQSIPKKSRPEPPVIDLTDEP